MTSGMFIPPFLFFFVGGLLTAFLKGNLRNAIILLIPVVSLINLASTPYGIYLNYEFLGYSLALFRVDKLSLVFGYAFHIVSIAILIYGIHVKENKEFSIGLIYAGAGLGAVFAYDLISLYVFWEIMTIASTFIIWRKNDNEAIGAGFRYFIFHLVGGLALLIGIVMYISITGNTSFVHMGWTDLATGLIMLGFGVNAAWPFVHTWVVDSYPKASFLGTVLLSVFTTKTAIYTLARGFAGVEVLIVLGAVMTVFPIFYAVLENDLRKVLSYSLINQLGFMVVGIGVGSELAINAAVGQAFVHIMFKSLLFMGMGAVLHQTGKIKATELGGLYKYMPLTATFTIIGSLTISAFPLFSAFVTKSMILSSVATEGFMIIWLVLLFASAGVLDHSGIKIPFFAFFGHDSGLKPKEAPLNMLIGMGILAFLNIFIGIFPGSLFKILPYEVTYNAYTADHTIFQLQLLLFSALAFTLLLRSGLYPAEIRSINLDFDFFYRKGYRVFIWLIDNVIIKTMNIFKDLFFSVIPSFLYLVAKNPMGAALILVSYGEKRKELKIKISETPDGYVEGLATYWSIGLSALLICLFLLFYLVFYLLSRMFIA